MKLYNSVGPNPRVVTMFLAEKGLSVPAVHIDIMKGENRQEAYVGGVNPTGTTPALELDDGSVLTEITAICEYLEERQPSPALIGSTPEERAATRMWARRVDLKICEPLTNGFRFAEGLGMFKDRVELSGQVEYVDALDAEIDRLSTELAGTALIIFAVTYLSIVETISRRFCLQSGCYRVF